GFLDDHVGEENPVGAVCFCSFGKGFEAHADDGIEVAEEDDAGVGASVADLAADAEDVDEARAAGDGALAGALNDGAVGERVAEGNAELDDVGARVDGGDGHVARDSERGVAGGEVDDEAGSVGEVNWHRRSEIADWRIWRASRASAVGG